MEGVTLNEVIGEFAQAEPAHRKANAAKIVAARAVIPEMEPRPLPLANGVLSPRARHTPHHLAFPVPGARHRLELTGFQMLGDVQRDLRW